jgi:hypothetical protein
LERIIPSISNWKVAESVRAHFTKFLKEKPPTHNELRMAIVGKIRDLFRTEFDDSFLNFGLLSTLQKYLESPPKKIHDVILNWPPNIAFKKEFKYAQSDFKILSISMNEWKISKEALSNIKLFVITKPTTKSGGGSIRTGNEAHARDSASIGSKRKVVDNISNHAKKART